MNFPLIKRVGVVRSDLRLLRFAVISGLCLAGLASGLTSSKHDSQRFDWTTSTTFAQGADLDYSTFKHNSQKHATLACTSCHTRTDNAAGPRFPGHKSCTNCHLSQFVTPNVPMCSICHTDVNSGNPPLKSFPSRFNEPFNIKFDHLVNGIQNTMRFFGIRVFHHLP